MWHGHPAIKVDIVTQLCIPRVTSKGDVRTWNKASGSGKLFSMDLMDESGEIRVTAFKEQCDAFYDKAVVGKVFFIR